MVPCSACVSGPSVWAALLFVVWLLASGPALADPDPNRTAVLRLFEETAFGGADGSPSRTTLLRPSGPSMPIVLYGAAREHRATVEPLARSISMLTGLSTPVTVADQAPAGRPDHIQVHLLDRSGMWRLLAGHQDWVNSRIIESVMQGLCFFITRGRQSVRGALVVVQAGLDDDVTAHCLAEEITQTFGPLSDSQAVQPSLFNDPGPHLAAMTAADRQVLALFYAPGMRPGLPRAEAMAIAGRLLGVEDR